MRQDLLTKITFFWMILTSLNGYAHEYHFSFIELAYNTEHKEFQASLTFSAHDITYIICKKNNLNLDFDNIMQVDSLQTQVVSLIQRGFGISHEGIQLIFTIEAYENDKLGNLVFYLKSEPVSSSFVFEFQFPFLLDYFPDQQNKLDFIHNGKHNSFSFLKTIDSFILPSLN